MTLAQSIETRDTAVVAEARVGDVTIHEHLAPQSLDPPIQPFAPH